MVLDGHTLNRNSKEAFTACMLVLPESSELMQQDTKSHSVCDGQILCSLPG